MAIEVNELHLGKSFSVNKDGASGTRTFLVQLDEQMSNAPSVAIAETVRATGLDINSSYFGTSDVEYRR